MYIKRIKELKDKLSNISVIIDFEDLIIYTTNGLPSEYNTFRTSIYTRSTSVSFEELHVLLISEEPAIDKQTKRDESLPQNVVFIAHNNQTPSQNYNP